MKAVVIFGAGQAGRAAYTLLNPNNMEVVAFGDNNAALWNDTDEIPVLPIAEALATHPNLVLIGVLDAQRDAQMKAQLHELGYRGDILSLREMHRIFDNRSATLKRMAQRIYDSELQGAVAELGVYRGDFAWQLNALFPDRTLYLFETFGGFDPQDLAAEQRLGPCRARAGDFSDTRAEDVLARMPYDKKVVLKKGHFPETAQDLEERFALVSIDVDLYTPTLAGLEYFYPRLAQGGVILLHDYNSNRFEGVKKAVQGYEAQHGRLLIIPLSDLHGTAVIIRGGSL